MFVCLFYITVSATERNYTLSDLEPGTTYQVWMTGSTSAGEGAASAVHHFSTSGRRDCKKLCSLNQTGILTGDIVLTIGARKIMIKLAVKSITLAQKLL